MFRCAICFITNHLLQDSSFGGLWLDESWDEGVKVVEFCAHQAFA